jgi:hypothetical protein
MDAQSNASEAALDRARRKRSRLVQSIDPAFPGVRGLRDLWQGWRDYRELWVTVGLYDIRKRYRRSLLGPFWITISLGAFILGLSFIYSPLMGGEAGSFLPYLAFGFIAWQFVSQLVLDGCNVFIANGPIIEQLQAPLSVYIYQTIWRHLIIFTHNLLIYDRPALWALAELADAARRPRHHRGQHQRHVHRHAVRHAVREVPRYPADRADHHPDDVPADADPVAA